MILCGMDIETTGFDPKTSDLTEIGYVIKEWKNPKPLMVQSMLIEPPEGMEISEEITQITKITLDHLQKAGLPLEAALGKFWSDIQRFGVDYIVAHNGENFDKPYLREYSSRNGYVAYDTYYDKYPWLDTMTDIEYPPEFASKGLIYIAACMGFVNPFPHAAVFDAFTCLKVLEHFDLNSVIKRSCEPWVVVRAMVRPPYNDPAPAGEKETDKAKARRYRWEDCGSGRKYAKCWIKQIKISELAKEQDEAPFKVVRIDNETQRSS